MEFEFLLFNVKCSTYFYIGNWYIVWSRQIVQRISNQLKWNKLRFLSLNQDRIRYNKSTNVELIDCQTTLRVILKIKLNLHYQYTMLEFHWKTKFIFSLPDLERFWNTGWSLNDHYGMTIFLSWFHFPVFFVLLCIYSYHNNLWVPFSPFKN